MRYSSKGLKNNNYFVLYNAEDEIICYFDNFDELSKHINYSSRKLAWEFNNRNTDIININIDNKRLKLATFC